jgi:hypothetical protein
MAPQAQLTKFAEFEQLPVRDEVLAFVAAAIKAADLIPSERGSTWGVTVCPDRKTVHRLNVGNVAQMSVYRGEPMDISIAVCHDAIGLLGLPVSLSSQEGFVRCVDDSVLLYGNFDEWSTRVFKKKRIVRAFALHAQHAHRRMADTNWHNPLINDLLDQ